MELHKKSNETGVIWITKVESKEKAIEIISVESGFTVDDITEEINDTGSFDDEFDAYNITHDKT